MPSSPVQLITHVLGSTFKGASWDTWRTVLRAAFALDLTDDERVVVEGLTHRTVLPSSPVAELWFLLGRRSGKTLIAALLMVWAATCRTYHLRRGGSRDPDDAGERPQAIASLQALHLRIIEKPS